MEDIKRIKDDPEKIMSICEDMGIDLDVDHLIDLDARLEELASLREVYRMAKNQATREMSGAIGGEEKDSLISQMKELDRNSDEVEEEYSRLSSEMADIMKLVAKIPEA
jgi:seryl-tRNA synthetase